MGRGAKTVVQLRGRQHRDRQPSNSDAAPSGTDFPRSPLPEHRRPGLTLYRYIAAEVLRPMLIALVGLTAVVVVQDLLGFSDMVINRGLSAGTVGWIAFYNAIPVAVTLFPFGMLVGCLVALGRLGADREILVLEASGIAAARLIGPIAAFAGVMGVIALLLSLVLAPWAHRSLDAALVEISRQRPWANIRAGTVSEFGGWQLEAREVSASGDTLRGVLLWMPDVGETTFAQSARIEATGEGDIEITLTDGSVVLSPRKGPRILQFDELKTTLPQSDEPVVRKEAEQLKGYSLSKLSQRVRDFEPVPGVLPRAALELHRRFSLPAATLVFGFLAVPLFLTRSRFSRSSGSVMGLLATISYYGLVQFGEGLVQGGKVGPGLAAWLPNLVLSVLAVGLLLRALREGVLGQVFDRPHTRLKIASSDGHERMRRPKAFALPRYIGGRFIRLVAVAFGVLLVAYLLIDVMERFEWFARHRATGGEILRFYGARIWLLASRVVPMALLVATSLTVSLLAAEGELVGMRSCGIPAPRALLPVLVIAAIVAPAYFLLNNVVVPRTNALADELKRTEIKESHYQRLSERRKAAVWYRSGSQVLEAERFDTDLGEARELAIYEIDSEGRPIARTDARSARHIGGGVWRLNDAIRVELSDGRAEVVPAPGFADLGEVLPAEVDTMHLSVAQLDDEIAEVEAGGYDATAFRVDYHVKLAEPLACLVLPAVVLFFAVGGPPFPGPAQTLLVSAVLGVSYILFTGVAASFAYGGGIPPALGGWAPTLAFSGLAGFFGLRIWRRM